MGTHLRLTILILTITAINAASLASVHLKFVSPPHTFEHGYVTDGGTTLMQKSFLSIGRRSPRKFGERIQTNGIHSNRLYVEERPNNIKPESAEFLWPQGVFQAPTNINDLGYSSQESGHRTPDFSDGTQYPDPYLLTGEQAKRAVMFLYGRGELFLTDYPHTRALLRNQEDRIRNGLSTHILSSIRPQSPFYKKMSHNINY
ncbi:uncharacterized protein LOC122512480 isoform X2 [Leptopilina heterotoma]|uniref:uncharacterized protein LOC122512480 isoform X2 n=1 Tax=Leptopilina heterotoma TaxID=63436 RepID=UPI001CA95483|nr:uncharacterized protein LOC122512480 isoform X2 [Leptopilina heterotoma]